jgi:UDP:flavonoid glycosyltransferase YjiC (YdhE family)
MPTALLVTADLGGNLPPFVSIARALLARGWTVQLLGDPSLAVTAERLGIGFTESAGERYDPVLPRGTLRTVRDISRLFADRRWGRQAVSVAHRIEADVVVVDILLPGATAECESAGLTTVVVVHTLLGFIQKAVRTGPFAAVLRLRGVAVQKVLDRADRVLVASDPALDPDTVLPQNTVQIGAALQETPHRRHRDGRPLVIVSVSSIWTPGQEKVLQRVLDGLAALPVDVVVTAGRAVDATALVARPNAVVRGFVDHAELLPEASLVVGHGGQATTIRALAHGVPVLVIPMDPTGDQPTIARAVARAGVGAALPKRAKPGAIRAAAAHLLGDERSRAAAMAFGERLAAHDAAAAAADVLDRLVAAPATRSR